MAELPLDLVNQRSSQRLLQLCRRAHPFYYLSSSDEDGSIPEEESEEEAVDEQSIGEEEAIINPDSVMRTEEELKRFCDSVLIWSSKKKNIYINV
jgi:hypothetical protein